MGSNNIDDRLKNSITLGDSLLINFNNLSDAEAASVLEMRNANSIREWFFNDKIISPREHAAFLSGLHDDKRNCYYLVKKKDAYSGVISLNKIDHENKNAYLGIYKNPHLQTTGVGSAIMDNLITLAFRILGLHTLKLEVFVSNVRAISLYAKFGFQREGLLREFIFRNNGWMDIVIMGLLNQENVPSENS